MRRKGRKYQLPVNDIYRSTPALVDSFVYRVNQYWDAFTLPMPLSALQRQMARSVHQRALTFDLVLQRDDLLDRLHVILTLTGSRHLMPLHIWNALSEVDRAMIFHTLNPMRSPNPRGRPRVHTEDPLNRSAIPKFKATKSMAEMLEPTELETVAVLEPDPPDDEPPTAA